MTAITVSQLVQSIRNLIENHPGWTKVWVSGEVTSCRQHSSGHWYFSLKDAQSQIRAVMFRRDATRLDKPLKDGQQVMVLARVGVFERDGQTQLYVSHVQDQGQGLAHQALEDLKRKLYEEGLFSRPKRPIPPLPRAIGVVTSGTGAARFDIETVVKRRYPSMPLVLYPVLVQGSEAPRAICRTLAQIQQDPHIDVLIIGRGGGSREDLMAFNDEQVVRAVACMPVAVISAVGHEIDTTLVDMVADLRAPTPSAAAELAVPEYERLLDFHRMLRERAVQAMRGRLEWERRRLRGWLDHGILHRPHMMIRDQRTTLDKLEERRDRAIEHLLSEERHRFARATITLEALNPRSVLNRGYSYVTNTSDQLVTASDVVQDEVYHVHWYNGSQWMKNLGNRED